MTRHNSHTPPDPLATLGQKARMEPTPKTDVSANVLRQIRVQNKILADKPLMWLTAASTAVALAMLIVCTPTLLTLMDPLNTLFQSTPTNLF